MSGPGRKRAADAAGRCAKNGRRIAANCEKERAITVPVDREAELKREECEQKGRFRTPGGLYAGAKVSVRVLDAVILTGVGVLAVLLVALAR